jgi:hypothetical protein
MIKLNTKEYLKKKAWNNVLENVRNNVENNVSNSVRHNVSNNLRLNIDFHLRTTIFRNTESLMNDNVMEISKKP